MTIQNKIFLMLLVLSLLMGAGILIPGYLKIRGIELIEAMEYIDDRSIRMKQEINRVVDVLQKAGVSNIKSYVEASKEGIFKKYEEETTDPRANKIILDSNGEVLYADTHLTPMPVASKLMEQMAEAENTVFGYESGRDKWLVSVQKSQEWGWYLLVSMSSREVYRNSLAYLYYVLSISAPVLLFVLGLYVVISRQIRRKITLIMDYIALYKDGQYEKRIPSSVPDEISVLQVGINSMIDSIEMEISSRKSIEEELHAAKLQAEQANQGKTAFLEHLSNEITEPMDSIIGYTKLLGKTELTKKQDAYTNNLLHLSENLKILINDALNFSKLGAEADKSNYVLFDLAQLVSGAIESSVCTGRQKNLDMKIEISDAIPLMVLGDQSRCAQIFSNLIHNAVKFTPDGSVGLHVDLAKETETQYLIKFTLLDTGTGLTKSDQKKILEPFVPRNTSSQSSPNSIGLGLEIVKGFLKTMGGSIKIQSEVGEGTQITIFIPFEKDIKGAQTGGASFELIQDITVLAVDHDEYNRLFLSETFAAAGIKCIVVETGEAILKSLEEEDVDLILMDMRLPNKASEVTINSIQKDLPTYLRDIPIIAVTTNVYEKDIERYSSLNVSAHIAKPIEPVVMFKMINDILQEQTQDET